MIISVPTAVSLELVAPAACSSSGSLDPVPAGANCPGAVATAGESSSPSGSAASVVFAVSAVGEVDAGVAEGVVVGVDGTSLTAGATGGEVSVLDGVADAGVVLSLAAECQQRGRLKASEFYCRYMCL